MCSSFSPGLTVLVFDLEILWESVVMVALVWMLSASQSLFRM